MHPLQPSAKIFLVGFMGAGKSTLGRLLADRLGWDFADVDDVIEAHESSSIVRLFAEKGEPYFRAVERRTLAALAASSRPAVVACGGGTFCDLENQSVMARHGLAVWVDQPFDQIWQRRDELARTRPLLRGEAELRALYAQRAPFYRLAPLHLTVSEGELPRALEELLRQLRDRFALA